MKTILSCTPDATTVNTTAVTDKKGYGKRWLFSTRHVDNLIAQGLPILKIGQRRVRIMIEEADRWMVERYGTQHNGAAKRSQIEAAKPGSAK